MVHQVNKKLDEWNGWKTSKWEKIYFLMEKKWIVSITGGWKRKLKGLGDVNQGFRGVAGFSSTD